MIFVISVGFSNSNRTYPYPKYIVVSAKTDYELVKKVEKKFYYGWECQGGVSTSIIEVNTNTGLKKEFYLHQAMILRRGM